MDDYDRDYDEDPLAFFDGLVWAVVGSVLVGGVILLAYACC